MFFFRIISNFEYYGNELVPIKMLLDSAGEDSQNMSPSSLGMLIRDVWEGKVTPKMSRINDVDKVTGYLNIRKRPINELHKSNTVITELTRQTVAVLLSASRPGWIVDSTLLKKKSIRLVHSFNPYPSGPVSIGGYRITMEIKISMVPRPVISISTCGREVPLSEISGLDATEISLRRIDEAISLLQCAWPCIGQTISSKDEDELFKLEVADSKVVTVTLENEEHHKQLVSTSCLLLRFRANACKNCTYAAKLLRNRTSKRNLACSSSNQQFPRKKCNMHFLSNMGLERKILFQRKQVKNEQKKELRLKETEMIELVEEDSCDLLEIMKLSNIKDVPPNLKLFWEQQVEQLSKQSPNGYRWNPRCLICC